MWSNNIQFQTICIVDVQFCYIVRRTWTPLTCPLSSTDIPMCTEASLNTPADPFISMITRFGRKYLNLVPSLRTVLFATRSNAIHVIFFQVHFYFACHALSCVFVVRCRYHTYELHTYGWSGSRHLLGVQDNVWRGNNTGWRGSGARDLCFQSRNWGTQ